MTDNDLLLLLLVRAGIRKDADGEKLRFIDCEALRAEWATVYGEASSQGVLAVAWDGLQRLVADGAVPAEFMPSRTMKMQWAYNVEQIERRYRRQHEIAVELAEIYRKADIHTIVLKGLAVSGYYPVPEHRPCGDLDCFLGNGYEKGNIVAEQAGAVVERDYYKHSHIRYKGLMIENHRFCTAIRGSRRAKEFERRLQEVLETGRRYIGDSALESPSPLFNALFLAVHAWGHFLTEGISLRHLCDWAMLLKAEGADIDWPKFRAIVEARDKGLYAFAESMTRLSGHYLGVACDSFVCSCDSDNDRQLMNDILYGRNAVFNTSASSWRKRWNMIVNYWSGRWKFSAYSSTNAVAYIFVIAVSYLFERNPKL